MNFFKQVSRFITYGIAIFSMTAYTLSTAHAAVYHFQPGEIDAKDVWIQPSHAGVGNGDTLHVWKASSVGGFKSLYEIPDLIPNLIPHVGNSGFISSATLNFFVLDTEGGGHGSHAPGFEGLTVPIKISAMANAWTEGTWNGGSPEAVELWNNSIAAPESAVTLKHVAGEDIGNWISIDVTQQVHSWLDYSLSNGVEGLPYYGFLIESPNEIRGSDNGVLLTAYHSSAALDSSLHPFLEVTTVPIPTAAWLFGSSLLGLTRLSKKIK